MVYLVYSIIWSLSRLVVESRASMTFIALTDKKRERQDKRERRKITFLGLRALIAFMALQTKGEKSETSEKCAKNYLFGLKQSTTDSKALQ